MAVLPPVRPRRPYPTNALLELLGIPESDRADLGHWFRTLLAPYPGPQPPTEAVAASEMIVDYLTALLDRKRSTSGEDLVTDLVNAADRDRALTEQEMLSTIFQLVVAGHDTTTSLIGNGTVALLRHPEQRDALVADPALVPRAVEECLRWDAPVPHSTFRYTTEEVRIGEVVIPAFAQVIVSLAAANRDPARYRNPESFDIHRSDSGHLALGHGIHFCLGAPLARVEACIALSALHTRFPCMRLAVDPAQLRWGHGDGLVRSSAMSQAAPVRHGLPLPDPTPTNRTGRAREDTRGRLRTPARPAQPLPPALWTSHFPNPPPPTLQPDPRST